MKHTTITQTPKPRKVRLTRTEGGYFYGGTILTADIWQFDSAYGDKQWGCDITYFDGRSMRHSYAQSDTLGGVRGTLANLDIKAGAR